MLTRERAPEEELDAAPRWSLDHIDWSGIARARARDDPLLFFLVTAASFVETGADLYAANLASHVDDPVAKRWLEHRWQFEELRHGRALRKYVETVWPELDWARGYADFMAEYSVHCTLDALDGSRALEMVARCVVEVGTSTYYTALLRYAPEPVLGGLVRRIRQDEVRHYNRFRGFFESYRRKERIGRLAVLRKLLARLAEAQDLDAYVAFNLATSSPTRGSRCSCAKFTRSCAIATRIAWRRGCCCARSDSPPLSSTSRPRCSRARRGG